MYPPKWRKNLAAVTLYLRCPKCRFNVELDEHGKSKCYFGHKMVTQKGASPITHQLTP